MASHPTGSQDHVTVCVTGFNKDGTVGVAIERCSCSLTDMPVDKVPKGGYLTVLIIPQQQH